MTKKPLAVVTSDCHLAVRTWQSRPTLTGDSMYSFSQIIDLALERGLPVIAAGDVIDKQRNESRVIDRVVKEIARLSGKGLKLYFIQGQHELQPIPWLRAVGDYSTVVWAHDRCFKLGDVVFQGLDWSPAQKVAQKLKCVQPGTRVLVLHQVVHEWLGGITAAEMSFTQIPEQIELVIIGDYHERTGVEYHTNASGGEVAVLSPGSTCLQSISEPPAKFCYVLYDDLSTEAIPLKTRPLLAPRPLSLEEHVDEFVSEAPDRIREVQAEAEAAGIPHQISRPIVYVKCAEDLSGAYRRIEKAVSPHGYLFYKELRSRPEDERAAALRDRREDVLSRGLLGALDELLPDTESEVYRISQLLLQAQNPRKTLESLRKERLGIASSNE